MASVEENRFLTQPLNVSFNGYIWNQLLLFLFAVKAVTADLSD